MNDITEKKTLIDPISFTARIESGQVTPSTWMARYQVDGDEEPVVAYGADRHEVIVNLFEKVAVAISIA